MKQKCHSIIPSFLSSTPFSTSSQPNETVITISNSIKQGLNWVSLSKKFNQAQLTNPIVQQVLLTLKEPVHAKRALGFFHWSARQTQSRHPTSNYALTIHITAKAKLLRDARALIESVLRNEESGTFLFARSLVGSYESVGSVPLVFDLLVQGYAKLRMVELGFDVCKYLGEQGFFLSVITYNTLLHIGQKSDETRLVWGIYEHMVWNRIYPNEVTIRVMISALCKEGKLQEYIDMLDRITEKRCSPLMIVNVSLVFRILQEGRVDEGMAVMKRMLQKGMILDTVSFSFVVYARVKFGGVESAYEVFEEMLNRGFRANCFVYTLFIGAYCEEGKVEDAIKLMQEMVDMGLKPYNETFDYLIGGCSKVGRVEMSMKFCKEMMDVGFLPSCLAFNEMVVKLCEVGRAKDADDMLTSLLDKGFKPNEVTYARIIDGYAKEGKNQEVLKLYYEMAYKSLSPDASVFESLISCFCARGKLDEAEKYLKVMKDRSLVPSRYAYEKMIDGYRKNGNKLRPLQLHCEMDGK